MFERDACAPLPAQAELPFKSKPKVQAARTRPTLEQRRAVALEPAERKAVSLVQQLNALRNEKATKRRAKQAKQRQARSLDQCLYGLSHLFLSVDPIYTYEFHVQRQAGRTMQAQAHEGHFTCHTIGMHPSLLLLACITELAQTQSRIWHNKQDLNMAP